MRWHASPRKTRDIHRCGTGGRDVFGFLVSPRHDSLRGCAPLSKGAIERAYAPCDQLHVGWRTPTLHNRSSRLIRTVARVRPMTPTKVGCVIDENAREAARPNFVVFPLVFPMIGRTGANWTGLGARKCYDRTGRLHGKASQTNLMQMNTYYYNPIHRKNLRATT